MSGILISLFIPPKGTKKENLTLNERVFQCENCGFECDRDLNAAINLSKIDLSKAVS
ncbi:zinc ribbon domain-containing protein [Nodularia spumigena CH309]|nr:zinc ribbon domain-containing protein [Nodularia spumigena]MEA5524092.1 zinc ribbon domain-containing protein [Nodularia spumigena UHCC 0143]MEA5558491.1 zinc ribbon domain-containing protein [Nodularia spumigena CH309]MEA5615336.1 zinc ribbon domain-containing protein [Nodularia spumigena UHCC 0040]